MAVKDKKTTYAAPAVDGMLDIIEFLAENPRPYGVAELSRELGVSTNLVFRIMKRLIERGYAEMDAESGGYQLGSRFFTLGMSLHSRFELSNNARKHLEWLCAETGETCMIQIPNGDRMLVLDSVNPAVDFYLRVVPGSRVYYHANAFGKVTLAFMSEEEYNQALPEKKLLALTSRTITSHRKLKSELREIRKRGLGYDREEYSQGIYCVGAPVFDAKGEVVAGTGVSGLSSRCGEKFQRKLDSLTFEAAENISREIGYAGDFYLERKGKL